MHMYSYTNTYKLAGMVYILLALIVLMPFRHSMEYLNADGRTNSGDDQATSYKFGGLLSSTSGVHTNQLSTTGVDKHFG